MIKRYDAGAGGLIRQSNARTTLAGDLGDSQPPSTPAPRGCATSNYIHFAHKHISKSNKSKNS